MRKEVLAGMLLLLIASGCTNVTKLEEPHLQLPNNTNNTPSTNVIEKIVNNSVVNETAAIETENKTNGNTNPSGDKLAELRQSFAEADFSDVVCNDLPSHAMHLFGTMAYVAVEIPDNLMTDLQAQGDQLSFTTPAGSEYGYASGRDGFVHDPSINGTYYWNCWINVDSTTYQCIMPITAEINDNGTTVTRTGAIKLTFEGILASGIQSTQTTSTQGTPENTGGSMGPKFLPLGAPDMASNTTPVQSTTQCDHPQNTAESGPHDVYSVGGVHWTQSDTSNSDCPRVSIPTFNRTGCEIVYDSDCPQVQGLQSCGECPYSYTMLMINPTSILGGSSSPALDLVPDLGTCKYCGPGTICGTPYGAQNIYGVCGAGCVTSSQTKPPWPYYVNCGQCDDGPVSYGGYDPKLCKAYYQECLDTHCQVRFWQCG